MGLFSEMMDEAGEKTAEIERLRETLKLHAGDIMSLSNELDEWRERALAAEEALAAVTNGDGNNA